MNKRFVSGVVLVLALFSFFGVCNASPITDKIDRNLNQCMDQSQGITSVMSECLGTAGERMDKRLNEVYKQLFQKLSAEQQSKLKVAQRKWLDFRDAELDLSWAIDPYTGGTLQRVNGLDAYYSLLKKRVSDLEIYLKSLDIK